MGIRLSLNSVNKVPLVGFYGNFPCFFMMGYGYEVMSPVNKNVDISLNGLCNSCHFHHQVFQKVFQTIDEHGPDPGYCAFLPCVSIGCHILGILLPDERSPDGEGNEIRGKEDGREARNGGSYKHSGAPKGAGKFSLNDAISFTPPMARLDHHL